VRVVLVDQLIYQGLPASHRRQAAPSLERDMPATIRMKKAPMRFSQQG
jgi:hypothetical protein